MPIPSLRNSSVVTDTNTAVKASLEDVAGTVFWVTKTLASTAITTGGSDLTGTSSSALAVLDVIVQTDATGLATGTNCTVLCNNASGLATFFSTAVSGLGANKTIGMTTASVTKQPIVLESGKKLTAKSTVADCDGTGNATFYIKFERLADNGTISAA